MQKHKIFKILLIQTSSHIQKRYIYPRAYNVSFFMLSIYKYICHSFNLLYSVF